MTNVDFSDMPFGLTNGPTTYQERVMMNTFPNLFTFHFKGF